MKKSKWQRSLNKMQWTEKYRPKEFNDIVGQEQTVNIIQKMMNNGGLPNILFYGQPGTGKTTLARIIANKLLGESTAENYSEFNASDDWNYSIRNTCLQTVKCMPLVPDKPKIILLDEADRLAPSTQDVLRRPFENSGHTVFILTANEPKKMSKAILSRLMQFEFAPMNQKDIVKRLKQICNTEDLNGNIKPSKLQKIAKECEGDVRQAINELQKEAMMI